MICALFLSWILNSEGWYTWGPNFIISNHRVLIPGGDKAVIYGSTQLSDLMSTAATVSKCARSKCLLQVWVIKFMFPARGKGKWGHSHPVSGVVGNSAKRCLNENLRFVLCQATGWPAEPLVIAIAQLDCDWKSAELIGVIFWVKRSKVSSENIPVICIVNIHRWC